jgi:hypothetical protein
MQRVLFTVTAQDRGWQLYEGEYGRFWFSDRAEALHTATVIASTLHTQHGIRSAVVMDMDGREAVVVSCHG